MKYRMLTAVAAAALLAACGGEDRKMSYAEIQGSWADAELFYSFPYHGQANVSLNTPLVLRFSDEVAGKLSPNNIKLVKQSDNSTAEWRSGRPDIVDGGRGMVLYTAHGLTANSEYCVEFDGLKLATGTANLPSNGFCFNTRVAPEKRGSLAEYGANDALEIASIFPSLNNSSEPVMDFSTIRVRFNQPVKNTQVAYGDQVKLEQGGELVDAVLLVKRNLMTIAPKQTLKSGKQYTLTIAGVEAQYRKDKLGTEIYRFTPQNSQPRTILAQNTVEARDKNNLHPDLISPCQVLERAGAEDPKTSPLTSQPINCVPMEAVLLGDKDSTMQYGDVFAELAFLPNFVEVSPLRVPRGSLLLGTNIDVRVAGVVNANGEQEFTVKDAADKPGIMKTGDVSVSFISDATGYLYSNPYSTDPEAPKQVKLFMDLAMTTEGMSPNASLSQDLLHVELNGMASLDGKSMQIDAVGIVEPDVLGTEVAFGFLSFQMKSYPQSDMAEVFKQQVDALKEWEATSGPKVLSVYPPEGEYMLSSDAITLHFDAPLDPSTIEEGLTLTKVSANDFVAHQPEEIEWYLDGASVVVKKKGGFKAGTEYKLELTNGITGLPFPKIESGKADSADPERRFFAEQGQGKSIVVPEEPLTFNVALADDGNREFEYSGHINDGKHEPKPFRYPVISTAYPGYPCAVEWQQGVGDAKVGHCIGDVEPSSSKVKIRPQHVPSNRPLHFTFSKPVTVGEGAFKVFEDATNKEIQGVLVENGFELSFIPQEPWEPGVLYKYVIETAFHENCEGIDGIICGTNGKPLMTAPLAVEVPEKKSINESPAFINSEMFFFGANPTKTVLQSLRNTPTLDPAAVMTYHKDMNDKAQAALEVDSEAEFPNSTKLVFKYTASEAFKKIITHANLGCLPKDEGGPESCSDKNYIHLAGNLDTEIFGAVEYQCLFKNDEEENGKENYCDAPAVDNESGKQNEKTFGDKSFNLQGGQALAVGIYPTALLAGSVDVFAKVGLTNSGFDPLIGWLVDLIAGTKDGWLPSPTGVQVMRMHPGGAFVEEEGNALMTHPLYKNNPNGLIPGWIRNTDLGPVFETRVYVYLDAPYLSVLDGTGSHNQRNYELMLDLRGPVEFLGDGRIQIHQRNLNAQTVNVELGDLSLNTAGFISLEIPAGGAYMMYQGKPVKE